MECAKCGEVTIEQESLAAGSPSRGPIYLVDGMVEVKALLCTSCGHIELGVNPAMYREVKLEYLSRIIRDYIYQERKWVLPPIEFEMTLSSLATKFEVGLEFLTSLTDDVIERLNDPDFFWDRRYEGPKDGVQFKLKGTGKGTKIVVKDTRPPKTPPSERF
jgi:hypothetical protein